MGEYLSPGVYVEEMAGPRPIEGASTSTAAFVGYTAKGEPGKPKFITSFGDYERHFGGFRKEENAFTPFAVKNFFDEGGSKAYVVRHAEKNASGEYKGSPSECEISVGFKVSVTDPVNGVFYDNETIPNEYDCTTENGDKISYEISDNTGDGNLYDKKFTIIFKYDNKVIGTVSNVTMKTLQERFDETNSIFVETNNKVLLSKVVTISNISTSLSTPVFGTFQLKGGQAEVIPTGASITLNGLEIDVKDTAEKDYDIKVVNGTPGIDRVLEIYDREATPNLIAEANISTSFVATSAEDKLDLTGALTTLPAVTLSPISVSSNTHTINGLIITAKSGSIDNIKVTGTNENDRTLEIYDTDIATVPIDKITFTRTLKTEEVGGENKLALKGTLTALPDITTPLNKMVSDGTNPSTCTLNGLIITAASGDTSNYDIKIVESKVSGYTRALEIQKSDGTGTTTTVDIKIGEIPTTTGGFSFSGTLTPLPNVTLHKMGEGKELKILTASSATNGSPSIFRVVTSSNGIWGDDVKVAITSPAFLQDIVETTSVNENTEAGIEANEKFTLSVLYKGVEVEAFEDLTLNDKLASSYLTTVVNEASNFISIDEASVIQNQKIPVGVFSLSGGGDDAMDADPMIPQSTLKEYFGDIDGISMLIMPDVQNMTNQKEGASYCDNRGDCFYISSSNVKETPELAKEKGKIGGMSRCAIYAPYIKEMHPTYSKVIEVPPAGAVAGIYARTDKNRGVFKAPAGTTDGQVRTALGLSTLFTKDDQALLNPIGINLIRNLSGVGNVIWGARTTAADAQWRYVPVRRLVTYIEKSIENSIQWAVFEPNSHELWSQLKREISGFLRGIWSVGGLFGNTEDEAFFVKIDEENNPQSSRDAGKLIVNIGVATVKPAEFVIIRIEQTQSDA